VVWLAGRASSQVRRALVLHVAMFHCTADNKPVAADRPVTFCPDTLTAFRLRASGVRLQTPPHPILVFARSLARSCHCIRSLLPSRPCLFVWSCHLAPSLCSANFYLRCTFRLEADNRSSSAPPFTFTTTSTVTVTGTPPNRHGLHYL